MGPASRYAIPLLVCAATVVGNSAAGPAHAQVAAAEPHVFSLPLAGTSPFSRLAPDENFSDVATLSDGRVVALPECCGRELYEVDVRGRSRVLRAGTYFEVEEHNAVIEGPDGALLFSERGRVLRRGADGTTSTVAGTPRARRASGDGGPAVGAGMEPAGLAFLPDGSLLIADLRSHRIRRVDTAGRISTVAGTGAAGSDGDGGKALDARIGSPIAVGAYPDGSYLIAHGLDQLRVRRVGVDGTISTVAGGGATEGEPCSRTPQPATSLQFFAEGFGDIGMLADGGFLITGSAAVRQVSPQGTIVALTCSPFGPRYRPDGRDIYVDGRPLRSAFLDGYGADVAVAEDGSIVLDDDSGESDLTLIATPGASRRLAVALAPATLRTIHKRQVELVTTAPATVDLRVYQRRRLKIRVVSDVPGGESVVDLADHLGPGLHQLRVIARAADGRMATHSLHVLGTPQVPIRLAKRLMKGYFYGSEVGEGEGNVRLSPCRPIGPRRVRCRARGHANRSPVRTSYLIRLRRNGVLVLVRRIAGQRRPYTTAVHPTWGP
jgi:hypothetical protein